MKKQAPKKDALTYAAFLRGINVGGNTIIKMEDLAKAFKAMGFSGIKTILASGNVVFQSSEKDKTVITKTIAARLAKIAGREISIIVRSMEELQELEADDPFKSISMTSKTKAFITFVPDYKKSMNTSTPDIQDDFSILRITDGMIVSVMHEQPGKGTLDLMGGIEKKYGKQITTRTWNTLLKVLKAGE
jgi:uncharacterized protein (DUF1697 family)